MWFPPYLWWLTFSGSGSLLWVTKTMRHLMLSRLANWQELDEVQELEQELAGLPESLDWLDWSGLEDFGDRPTTFRTKRVMMNSQSYLCSREQKNEKISLLPLRIQRKNLKLSKRRNNTNSKFSSKGDSKGRKMRRIKKLIQTKMPLSHTMKNSTKT